MGGKLISPLRKSLGKCAYLVSNTIVTVIHKFTIIYIKNICYIYFEELNVAAFDFNKISENNHCKINQTVKSVRHAQTNMCNWININIFQQQKYMGDICYIRNYSNKV